jgi:hypothetical protein
MQRLTALLSVGLCVSAQDIVPGMTAACIAGISRMSPVIAPAVVQYTQSNAECLESCNPTSLTSCGAECSGELGELQDTCHTASGTIYQEERFVEFYNGNDQLTLSYLCFPTSCSAMDILLWSNFTTNSTCAQVNTTAVELCKVFVQPDDSSPSNETGPIIAGVVVGVVGLGLILYVAYLGVRWRWEHRGGLAELLPMLDKQQAPDASYHRRVRHYNGTAATTRQSPAQGSLANLEALVAVAALRKAAARGTTNSLNSQPISYAPPNLTGRSDVTEQSPRSTRIERLPGAQGAVKKGQYNRLHATHGGIVPSVAPSVHGGTPRKLTVADTLISDRDNSIL